MSTQHVWDTYQADVRRLILTKVKDEALAEDLVQETFIKIHTKMDTLKDPDKLKSWIFSIANNLVMDYFRRQPHSSPISGNYGLLEDEQPIHDEKDCLRGIINHLPEKYRDPLFMSDIEGLKQAEVARRLNLPLSTTKSRIQRARKQIAEGYMECCDFKLNDQGFLVGEIKDKAECKICR